MADRRQQALYANLRLRARILQAIRSFFIDGGYLEVETPVRIPSPAPEAHIDAVPSDGWFLQTSPELAMKRLLASGHERIYQICKCFRRGERGGKHLPELTLLEWYTAGADYRDMMRQCEALIATVARAVRGDETLRYQGKTVDFRPPWDRVSVAEAFDRFGSVSMDAALASGRFDEVMGLEIEPRLGWRSPVFLFDYPADFGALARLKPSDARLAERFELYIGGVELCNAFTELADPVIQQDRFTKEQALRRSAGKPVYPMPEKFLRSLASMPEAAGNALGVDRLMMLFADTPCIDDVVAFTPEEL